MTKVADTAARRLAPGGVRAADDESEWWPGVDGLRGLAVAAVLVYHHDASWLPGGYLGVSLFFTISGFLITTLLLREHAASGGIDLRRFWVRRARRLIPIAWAGLVLAGLVAWATRAPDALGSIAGDIRAAGLHLANWRQAGAPVTYGDTLSTPSPVTHYWSLAIEEQFYLLYPLLAGLALRRGRRWLAGLLVTATAASVAAQLTITDVNRAYLGTDTRLAELTIGSLLALVLIRRRTASRGRAVDVAGAAALVALGVAWGSVHLGARLFDGVLVAHSLLAAAVIAAAVGRGAVARFLGAAPLVWVGSLSYGLYVVHYPVYLMLSSDRTHLGGVPLLVVRLAATVLLAVGLHHLVERPVRWGRALPGWQGGVALVSGLGIVLVLATSLPYVGRDGVAARELAIDAAAATVVTMDVPEVSASVAVSTATSTTTTTSPTTAPRATPSAGRPSSPPPVAAPVGPDRALRVLVVGDSTAMSNGLGLQRWASETGLAAVDLVGAPGCALSEDGEAIYRDGWTRTEPPPACVSLLASARAQAAASRPDVVLLFIGSVQLADWLFDGDTQVRRIGDAAFDARYDAAARAALEQLEGLGVPVLFATLPVPDYDPTLQFPGQTFPGAGPLTMNDAGRARLLNERNRVLVRGHPRTRFVPYAELISAPDGSVSRELRPDGMHLDPEKVPGLMRDGLEALLRDAYRDVVLAQPTTARPGRTIWSP